MIIEYIIAGFFTVIGWHAGERVMEYFHVLEPPVIEQKADNV
jgi:hypothetical protein